MLRLRVPANNQHGDKSCPWLVCDITNRIPCLMCDITRCRTQCPYQIVPPTTFPFYIRFAGTWLRHGEFYDLLPMIRWHLHEAWQDVRFVVVDLLVSVRGMTRCMFCCLWFSIFCVRHGKIHDLLSVICWQGKKTITHVLLVQSLKPYTLNPKNINLQDRR